MNLVKASLIGALLALSVGGAHAATNLVTNGDFETGDLTGWSGYGWFVTNGIADVGPNSGNDFASTGCVGFYCTLEQDVATMPGESYTLSFAFNPGLNANSGADTHVAFGGTTVADMSGGSLGWSDYSINVTATDSTTALVFSGYQNPAWNGVDDVSLTSADAGGVPEPATWAMMLLGLGGAGASLRRRNAV
jgi:hypothetical protein